MSSEATKGQTPDQYGQLHPVETPELLSQKLKEFEEEVQKLDDKKLGPLQQAQEKCPALLTKEFKLMFLRCEVFNADLAACRYAHYWEKRVEVFGEKAFLPLTLEAALVDDWTALTINFIRVIPGARDPMGRSIVYLNPQYQDRSKYELHSMARAFWYMIHTALENEETQKHGIVFLVFPHRASLNNFDRELSRLNISCIQGAMPVRVSAFHICRPPSFFKVIMVFVRLFTSKRTQKRMLVHFGNEQSVLEKLSTYGLEKSVVIPTEMGGSVELDVVSWLEGRKESK